MTAFEFRLRRGRALHGILVLAVACLCFSNRQQAHVHVSAYAAFSRTAEEVSIPLAALCVGGLCSGVPGCRIPSKLMVFFGAQTGMLLLSKILISRTVVSEELGLYGLPAPFLMTALHQFMAVMMFGIGFLLSWTTPWPYMPQPLTKLSDVWWLLLFSASFAANIGLNNFSFQFLPLSLNLLLRSCLPIATTAIQTCVPRKVPKSSTTFVKEIICMLCGISCAALATLAQSKSKAAEPEHHYQLGLGVAIETMSIFAGALNMVLANELGKRLNLGSMDMTFYMSLPAALFLLVPSIFLSSPSWPEEEPMTDCQVFSLVYQLAPGVLGLACLLGVFACAYNVLQIDMAQSLSATYTTFAGLKLLGSRLHLVRLVEIRLVDRWDRAAVVCSRLWVRRDVSEFYFACCLSGGTWSITSASSRPWEACAARKPLLRDMYNTGAESGPRRGRGA